MDRHASPLPLGPLVMDAVGSLVCAAGLVIVYVPDVVPAGLAGMLTPAVGWTAFGVGVVICAAATLALVQALRSRRPH